MIYRSISLLAGLKESPFARDCHYEEAMSTRGMTPLALGQRIVAEMRSRSFNAMAKSINIDGALDQLGRTAMKQLMGWVGPKPGQARAKSILRNPAYRCA